VRGGGAVNVVYGLYARQSGGQRDRCYQYVFNARATVHECNLTLVHDLSAGFGRSDTPQLAEGHRKGVWGPSGVGVFFPSWVDTGAQKGCA
jgi:hypothetical protein